MAMMCFVGLFVAFVASVSTAAISLLAASAKVRHGSGGTAMRLSGIVAIVTFAALTLCCAVLVYCFFTGDLSIKYVVEYRSDSSSPIAWLYLLSGLWAGRQGSLLFWAWLISAFNLYVSVRYGQSKHAVDSLALGISNVVLAAFLGVLLFSESNMPFTPLPASYLDVNGRLTGGAELYGMNPLLEHWAMAIHPPALFIGYAGMTIPFAYAVATLVLGDDSATWVEHVNGITAFAWLFLGAGIGLGAVWAYVVLGWGGYWGWDPVENASLLSWLACVGLMHSFTLYRKRGMFKRWSIVAACFTFMFVIVGTFISRSGLVQSVHAFAGDTVSLVLFAALIAIAFVSGLFGAVGRRGKFGAPTNGAEESVGFLSKEMAYYLNNVLMMVGAFLLAYLTVSSALPEWLPLGGQSLTPTTYNAIARPLGIVFMAIVAICPLLGWRHTNKSEFAKNAVLPAVCSAVLFALLVACFLIVLLPAYDASLNAGTTAAQDLAAAGPSWYYNGLAVLGFLVASILVFNSLFMLMRFLKRVTRTQKQQAARYVQAGKNEDIDTSSLFRRLRANASTIGGFVAHLALGIILIGLIGSSMYVTEVTGYLASSPSSKAATKLEIQGLDVVAVDSYMKESGGDGFMYELDLKVERAGEGVALLTPKIQVDPSTMQRKYEAAVISYPLYDFFAVYRGLNADNDYSVDIRINPLISFVWIGFFLLMLGTAIGAMSSRGRKEGADVKAHVPSKGPQIEKEQTGEDVQNAGEMDA